MECSVNNREKCKCLYANLEVLGLFFFFPKTESTSIDQFLEFLWGFNLVVFIFKLSS